MAKVARAGRPEGMSDGYRTAIGVDPSPIELAHGGLDAGLFAYPIRISDGRNVGQHLRGERFVDLPQSDVGEAEAMPREQAWYPVGGRHQEPFRMEVDCRHFVVDEPRERCTYGESPPTRVVGDPAAGRSIGDGGTVAGRQAALSALPIEGWL